MRKLFIGFCGACVIGGVFLIWQISVAGYSLAVRSGTIEPAAADLSFRSIAGRAGSHPENAANPSISASNRDVRWAGKSGEREAQRRLSAAERMLADDPTHVEALRDKAAGLIELGRWDEAAAALERVVILEPDSVADRVTYGEALARVSRWTEAVNQFERIVEVAPLEAKGLHNLAVAHQALGHLADARAAWTRVIELSPGDAEAHARRAEVLVDLQEWPAAALDLESLLRIEPDAVDAALNLSVVYARQGREADARRCVMQVLERRPQHVPALNRLAELAWLAYCADAAANAEQRTATINWCRRSLEIDARQAVPQALLKTALAASANPPAQ